MRCDSETDPCPRPPPGPFFSFSSSLFADDAEQAQGPCEPAARAGQPEEDQQEGLHQLGRADHCAVRHDPRLLAHGLPVGRLRDQPRRRDRLHCVQRQPGVSDVAALHQPVRAQRVHEGHQGRRHCARRVRRRQAVPRTSCVPAIASAAKYYCEPTLTPSSRAHKRTKQHRCSGSAPSSRTEARTTTST